MQESPEVLAVISMPESVPGLIIRRWQAVCAPQADWGSLIPAFIFFIFFWSCLSKTFHHNMHDAEAWSADTIIKAGHSPCMRGRLALPRRWSLRSRPGVPRVLYQPTPLVARVPARLHPWAVHVRQPLMRALSKQVTCVGRGPCVRTVSAAPTVVD